MVTAKRLYVLMIKPMIAIRSSLPTAGHMHPLVIYHRSFWSMLFWPRKDCHRSKHVSNTNFRNVTGVAFGAMRRLVIVRCYTVELIITFIMIAKRLDAARGDPANLIAIAHQASLFLIFLFFC